MATDHFYYLGNGAGTIYYLDFTGQADAIRADVKANANLALIAFTADRRQMDAHPHLKRLGFRKMVRFKSAHNNPNEVLTMWVKVPKRHRIPDGLRSEGGPYNCSVTFGPMPNTDYAFNARCHLVTTKPKGKGYIKVPNAPFWYRIESRYLAK